MTLNSIKTILSKFNLIANLTAKNLAHLIHKFFEISSKSLLFQFLCDYPKKQSVLYNAYKTL